MSYGAAGGVCIDVDDRTLQRARNNLSSFAEIEVRRQSIYDISYENEFDVTFSIGVIHHLKDPARAVTRLVQAAKPGGDVLVWLYGRENNGWIVYGFNPMRRLLFSWLPLRLVHALSLPLTSVLWLALAAGFTPIAYFRQIRRFSFDHLRAIVFDHMIPKIAIYYTHDAAEALLRDAGLVDVHAEWVNENSWSVHGKKPLSAQG